MRVVGRSAWTAIVPRTCIVLLCASAEPPPLKFHDVAPDGDCLFSAVALSQALVDNQPALARARALRTAASRLRAEALDALCPNGAPNPELEIGGLPAALLIEPLGGESEVGYCKRMRSPGQWGSTAELLALTKVLGRPIRVHTDFGVEQYGEAGERAPLAVHFRNSHYRAVTEPKATVEVEEADEADCEVGTDEAALRLRGGASAPTADEATAEALLDALHAAASRADADAYFALFDPTAVFLGTDASERWPLDEFRRYAGARFAKGDGWTYDVRERHVTVLGDVAWFDERLQNAKLGACRASGVLLRDGGGWRVAQFNLAMAIPNDKALEVAALVG